MKWLVAMVMVVMLGAGCASTQHTRAIKTGKLLRASHEEVVAARQQVLDTMAVLDELAVAPQSELPALLKQLKRETKAIEKAANQAAKRTNAYRRHSSAHVRAWAAELDAMNDEAMRKVGQRHRAESKQNFEQIEKKSLAVREAYWPFSDVLGGICGQLESNLTVDGVVALNPQFLEARQRAEVLESCIDNSTAELTRVADLLAPETP